MLEKFPQNHPMRFKFDQEVALLHAKSILFYIVLM